MDEADRKRGEDHPSPAPAGRDPEADGGHAGAGRDAVDAVATGSDAPDAASAVDAVATGSDAPDAASAVDAVATGSDAPDAASAVVAVATGSDAPDAASAVVAVATGSDAPDAASAVDGGNAQDGEAEGQGGRGGPAPPWRNPWVIAFVLGAVTLTLLRPCMQYVPEAPPVEGQLGAVALEGLGGAAVDEAWFSEHAVLLHFFFARDTRVGPRQAAQVEALYAQWAAVDAPVRILSVSVVPDQDDAAVRASWLERRGAAPDAAGVRWEVAGGTAEGVRSVVAGDLAGLLGFDVEGPQDLRELAWSERLVLVDGALGIRGVYDGTREDVVDEVLHRALHIVRDQGVARP